MRVFKTGARASTVSAKDWDDAVAVNYTATYDSVAVCLPHMLQHGEGSHFVVTSSMSGLLPGGPLGVYTATKIAAVGLMEALRVELEGTTRRHLGVLSGRCQHRQLPGYRARPIRFARSRSQPERKPLPPPDLRRRRRAEQRTAAGHGSDRGRRTGPERRHSQ